MTRPPHLRVLARVARPAGAGSRRVAAVVRFYLRDERLRHRLPGPSSGDGAPLPAPVTPTVQRTFQFEELRAFLEANRARAAVAGMLSLLPLDLGIENSQAWAGFISSALCLAASRSLRRNLGGMIGIVRIDGFGSEEEGDGGHGRGWRTPSPEAPSGRGRNDGSSSRGVQPSEASSGTPGGAAACCNEEGGGGGGGSEELSCPICYEDLSPRRAEATTMPCGHGFHRGCIARWLQDHRTCPVCRFSLPKVKDWLMVTSTAF